ncbi:MAG: D-aminoacylase [Kordiimonadaceae bacterium]|jgi:N-acyl-D-amino-acid deacylase|nr:D-aminoacylase [Kordiimonadaceae bacterium]
MKNIFIAALIIISIAACSEEQLPVETVSYDKIIRGGTIHDGLGSAGVIGDVAINGDRIVAVGDLGTATGTEEIDASGLVVSPGFVNMLSHSMRNLIHDPRGMSELKQGVTMEIFGEGTSMGPLNEQMRQAQTEQQGDIKFDISWTTLGDYLSFMEDKGISPNIASFIGATTARINEIGYENRLPTEEELVRMQQLVIDAMNEGALGVGSSLIYAPASYSDTNELVALNKAASVCGGSYISHLRSEGNLVDEAIDELITIAREADIPAEIYHLKAAGKDNWDKMDPIIERIEQARADGLKITADMYSYTAGATGLDAMIPPWIQEGGINGWTANMQNPELRAKALGEMRDPNSEWENLGSGSGYENVITVGFKNPELRHLIGKTLLEISEMRGTSPEDTAMDLVIEDNSRVGTIYFMMSEENIKKKLALPWVSFGSDAGAQAPEGLFLNTSTHPRAYGNFSRVLGKYVRDEKVLTLSDAVRRMSSLPASNLKLKDRGVIATGYYADLAIFDASEIADVATFEEPHQYAVGMKHVFVNGVQALKNGEHTGNFSGRFVKRDGYENQCSLEDIKL